MSTRVTFFGLFIVCLVGTFLVTASAFAENGQKFIQKAMIGNQFEISSSQLALQTSQNQDVKDFAQQMVNDHTEAANNLKQTVASSSVKMDQPSPSMDSKHQKLLDKLRKASGADFDKMYIDDQVSAHNDAVKLFKNYAANGDNPDLKAFAAQTLPVLQQHQAHIKQLKDSE